ncbi:MAG: TonB-dependent receptor plug domain-containing protein, partial [Thiohalobacteraceae bacterium]
MFKSTGGHASLIVFILSSSSLHAAGAVRLEPVVVSATRSLQSSVPTPAAISIIDRTEIEASGALQITEVLRGRGGVQLSDPYGDGSRAVIGMRGFGENAAANTLILVDGRRLNNSDLAAPDLNSIALKDVERIEIIHGSAGVLFGDQAVGGVINIITRVPRTFSAEVSA